MLLTTALALLLATTPETLTATAVVVDEAGRPVDGLTASDVAVTEKGVARELVAFEKDARPLAVAVVVDTSEAQRTTYRQQLVPALLSFLDDLPPGSKTTVWATGDRPTRLTDWGTPQTATRTALEKVFPRGGNVLFDTIVDAARDLGKREGERAVLVVVTGSGPGFTNYDRRRVVDAVPATVTVLSARYDGAGTFETEPLADTGGRLKMADVDWTLGELGARSGGRREMLVSPMGLAKTLGTMATGLRAAYRVTWKSAGGDPELTVARPGVTARIAAPKR